MAGTAFCKVTGKDTFLIIWGKYPNPKGFLPNEYFSGKFGCLISFFCQTEKS
jgi:hypothetical protein